MTLIIATLWAALNLQAAAETTVPTSAAPPTTMPPQTLPTTTAQALAPDCTRAARQGVDLRPCDLLIAQIGLAASDRSPGARALNADALSNRALILASSSDAEAALRDLAEALALQPARPELLINRAWIQLQQGRNDAAIQDLDTALAALSGNDPLRAIVLFNRAFAWRALGNLPAAQADLDRAYAAASGVRDADTGAAGARQAR